MLGNNHKSAQPVWNQGGQLEVEDLSYTLVDSEIFQL
jgi:hypothetical protein